MKKIFKSSIFWAIFVLATLVVFSFLTNLSRFFRAETDLLIVAKNELTAKNFDGIVNDSLHIPYSLSFYEKVILENKDIEGKFVGLSDFSRQSSWEKKISLSRIDGSGIVRISVTDEDKKTSEEMSRQSALTLANYLAKDYNIKTELEAKIINGPISNRAISLGFLPLLFLAVISGLAAAFVFCWTLLSLEKINLNFKAPQVSLPVSLKEILKKKEKLVFWEGEPFEIKKKETEKVEKKAEKEKEIVAEKKEVRKEEISFKKTEVISRSFGKKASAPANLPINDEEAEFLAKTSFELQEEGKEIQKEVIKKEEFEKIAVEAAEEKPSKAEEAEVKKDIDREPTEEEVRQRMFKLEKIDSGSRGKNPSAEEAKKKLNDLLQGRI